MEEQRIDGKTIMELYQENIQLKRELQLIKTRIVDISPVKGKGDLEIHREGDIWIVVEHRRKEREFEPGTPIDEMFEEITTEVPHKNVQILYAMIKKHCPLVKDKVKYKVIAEHMIKYYKLDMDKEAFNGGANRKIYFRLYQFPAKILHKLGYVHYSLKGVFTRLK